jgi:hypothetical protein
MFDNLLSQMKTRTDEIKKKLDTVKVEAEAENGLVKVTANGNRKIINIEISENILSDKETLEDLIIVAVNKAMEKSEAAFEAEMGTLAKGMMPDIGSLLGKK